MGGFTAVYGTLMVTCCHGEIRGEGSVLHTTFGSGWSALTSKLRALISIPVWSRIGPDANGPGRESAQASKMAVGARH